MFACGLRKSSVRLALVAALVSLCADAWCSDDATTRTLVSLDVPVTLSSTKAALIMIDKCRAALPGSETKQHMTEAEELLAEGLLIGWNPDIPNRSMRTHTSLQLAVAERDLNFNNQYAPHYDPPQIYLKSLANDAAACRGALDSNDAADAQAILAGIIADLTIKAQDCLSQGMGRTITFKVKTLRGQAPDRGWTVYFKWLTVSNLVTDEMPFPKMSTPAFNDLPPGLYRFRAEKKDPQSAAAASSETKMCQVDEAHQECEVQVP
jgi:hypothetical protein